MLLPLAGVANVCIKQDRFILKGVSMLALTIVFVVGWLLAATLGSWAYFVAKPSR